MGEPRLPHNLQGLLRFCMQVGDNPQVSADISAMDPERARWLREAMDSMTVDIGKQLRDNIAKLLQNADPAADGDAEAAETCLTCLEVTGDLCDNLDIANDFVKLGGLEAAAYVCRRCRGGRLRAASLHLLARLFQNNPFAQAAGLACLRDLVCAVRGGGDDDVSEPRESGEVRFAALSALSCLVRDCPAAQAALVDADGFAAIADCLLHGRPDDTDDKQPRRRLRRKAAFLLASLAGEEAGCLTADDGGAVAGVVAAAVADSVSELDASDEAKIADEDCVERLDWLEHALRCLLLLQQRWPRLLDDVGRRSRLTASLESLLGGPCLGGGSSETGELARQLLARLNSGTGTDGAER